MIKMIAVNGPATYTAGASFDRPVGDIEEIDVSSGKVLMCQMVSSGEVFARVNNVSGNIASIRLYGPVGSSGINLTADWASTTAVFSTVEIAMVVEGH